MNSSNSFTGSGSSHRPIEKGLYVISEDIHLLVNRWCQGRNLIPPDTDFYSFLRSRMKQTLSQIFPKVIFVSGDKIRSGLLAAVKGHREAGLYVVSLEHVYLEPHEIDARIELTRSVGQYADGSWYQLGVHSPRHGSTGSRAEQLAAIGNKKIALIDDVLYSGKTLKDTIHELTKSNTSVVAVTVAIGVNTGIRASNGMHFHVTNMPEDVRVEGLEIFDYSELKDQICERDFYPGVPYSGREHYGADNLAFPYVAPFGDIHNWASIPEQEINAFSVMCLDNTIALWEEIESINNIRLGCFDVPRPVYGSPKDGTRFVDFVKSAKAGLLKK